MEIEIDKTESNNYFGEVLAVMSNYQKLAENPKRKIRGLNFQAIALTGIAAVFLMIFTALYLLDPNYTSFLYVIIIFLVALFLGIIYIILIRRRISRLKNNNSDKKLIIEDDYVEMHIGDEQFRLNFTDMQWIILNRYSITFLPKTKGATLIAVEIKYKDTVIKSIKDKSLIVDNSDLY
ncbi:MAG: hypothetical protein IJL02_01675 [Methanobrevibacter sp.]|uniref:hypothetical protein n=1 Tax=Methanobrevibacter sp. TaxID=66852 RepID=UPI002600F388|nr:hypothetical protein [Methanobrevibacter sp.]MBQ6098556.1 hypothetical protein [Methanobrevibacter sp.]